MEIKEYSGLSTKEVQDRTNNGQVNVASASAQKTNWEIIRDNVFTLFNALNFTLALLLLLVGAYSNMAFIAIIILNIFIGIIQEIRARNLVSKLTIVSQEPVKVLRDGKKTTLMPSELVLDDLIILEIGDQIPSDSIILSGSSEVNESLLTGESDAISKNEGDNLLSGSYLTSGLVLAKWASSTSKLPVLLTMSSFQAFLSLPFGNHVYHSTH